METRKILSVIGNISTGKSSFLNYLLGSDILQTGNDLKTRFIVIIRHTENDEPVLSHIIRKRSAYEDVYIKVEDSQGKTEYKGKREIIEKIDSLNVLLKKDEDEGKLDYANYLYLLETRIKNIHNQDFLNNFDLADIPGLNNMSKDGNNRFKSIKAIFTPLKRLIQYGFLIFGSKQYEGISAKEILAQIMSEEDIKFNHFLIIFNKIDLIPSQERESAFLAFKAHLNHELGDDLLNDTNSIITMNSLELLEEEKVMENFNNFLTYHFKRITNDTCEKYFRRLVSYGYYMNHKSSPRKKYSDIEKMLDPDTELDEEFRDQIAKIAENVGLKLNLSPDDDEEHYENICKLFNLLKKAFSKKEVFFYKIKSEYRKKIDEFFDNKDFISLNSDKIKKEDDIEKTNMKSNKTNLVNEQLINCMEKLKSFYRSNIRDLQSKTNKTSKKERNINIDSLGERMENLEKLIACHDKVRITVYGTYCAGKSSTLNSFIGKKLLQEDHKQCTGKPILIRYLKKDEKPKIYKAELKVVKDYDKFSHYGFIEKGKALAEGEEAVKNFISSQNINIMKHPETKEDKKDEFFILKTPIKILDELDLSEEIKNNVEFLDTPGLGTDLMKHETELLSKLIEQTFIYLFIIDPEVGGADTSEFKDVLENTILKTIYNRSIINNSINFPYLFICNKCDNETIDFDLNNCNKNINLIIKSKDEKFDIIKFSAHKRFDILNKMNEYTPENFIEKVEKDFFNILHSSSKTFYDYLNDYIPKDFKNNFNGQISNKFEEDKIIKDKIIEILKKKDYEINVEKDAVLSKLSGYLSFCNNNFKNLKIADNKMMDELKNKIKSKINIAYEHITEGYRTQVQTALNFIKIFIKIGVIPDSDSKRNGEKDVKKAEKILKEVTNVLEKYDIPKDLQEFRQKIIKEIKSKDGLKDDYYNYEKILEKKQNFINNELKELSERSIPNSFENIKKDIIKIIENNLEGLEISFKNGKMIIKEKPSFMGAAKNFTEALGIASIGAVVVAGVYELAFEQAIIGGLLVGISYAEPGFLAVHGLVTILSGETVVAGLTSLLTPFGWFAALAGGAFLVIYSIHEGVSSITERKQNAYYEALQKIKEKFFSLFNGFEKKVTQQYNANKEKIIEEAASFLNMCYDPVQLEESERKKLLKEYENLENEIKELVKKKN